ncbi:WD40 repeat domain-containing protein [Prosthecomicrobium pneumaticum]|uniref:WD40 repeat protein n=1 Tax=Prosthecomicrobium pneumaticum TaxID=81895 RepID=A0A7W9CV29_9HYPH|nr:WD40 repeat domain-containing protein [Prosthecomicrobium pneumaticum]MBB5752475.1 WD40 repeat protein [Prosthecomicrobium pneumaticum]
MPTIQTFPLGGYVVAATFLDGRPVFATGDGRVAIVDGPAAETVPVHDGGLLAAAATWDGKRLATAGDDGKVALIDAAGHVEEVARLPKKWIDTVATGPDGALAWGSGRQAYVRLANGREKVLEHERAVGGLAFAPKGLRLAVARYNGVSLWFPATDAAAATLEWKGSHIGVTFSPDGKYVVTTMQENALHGWTVADGKHMRMSGYPGKVRSMSWSPKGRYLATSGSEAAVCWPFHYKDGPMGRQPLQLGPRAGIVSAVACHPTEEVVAIGYRDGEVAAVRFADGNEAGLRAPGSGGPITALAWDRRGERLAFGGEDGTAGVIDLAG